ncbi:hypothetical protein LIP36_09680 [Amedibacillus dolichus]|uniref:hypothetical protein n=1 Tax=Amedibacillus dolichus TaxID=31971 RepID=UPI001D02E9E4|nr:hypothetical protein [Amedibacillus dolichus]MCB5373870.1 hypothetical protein [Amedibacillus dolichus]
MNDIIKVFDISNEVSENLIDQNQRKNILNLFKELGKETHLITNCFLDTNSQNYEKSPIYYFYECNDKENFDYKKIADDLLQAECKSDNTRNSTIREGLLFIKANSDLMTIMKLEKLAVIDKDTYAVKSELGKEKDYFKVCIFGGNYFDIKIIDKNKTAAKYWYQKFLKLTRKRTSSDNTVDVINLITNDKFYKEDICKKDNYCEIKRFTEYYLFDNKKFDKSDLFNELNSSGLIELKKEDDLFSSEAENVDSDFEISEREINKKYQKKIKTSDEITITTKNYLASIRDNELCFDEKNKKITILIDDDYLSDVKEKLKNE